MVNLSTLLKITQHFVKPILSTASNVKLLVSYTKQISFALFLLEK